MTEQKFDSIQQYENLLSSIKELTDDLKKQYCNEVKCKKGCNDCCNNLFNISIIEGFYLQSGFNKLPEEVKKQVEENIKSIRRNLIDKKLNPIEIKCPLLIDGLCALYEYRPMICRTFGFPMLDEKSGEIATCTNNFTSMRDKEYTIRTLSSKLLSAQTVLLSQYLLKELGKDVSEEYIPPLYSVVEILMSEVSDHESV